MELKALLKKYMSGKIKAEEFKQLRHSARNLSDKSLDSTLEVLWAESGRRAMDPETKKEVRETLQRELFTAKRRNPHNWRNIAVIILLPLFALSTTYLFIISRQATTQEFVVRSAKGQKTQVDLPDGTKVWLNSASQIRYNSRYNQKNRYISLKGEAFFDVKEDKKTIFIVDVGGVSINVRGTAFNVTAYEGDSLISVSLNRGKVNLENTYSRQTIASLLPNQQITINRKNLSTRLMKCDAELNSLWTQNRLKLEDVSTEELFKNMEHWYGVNIDVKHINPNNIYSLTIKTESLREMLDLINKLTPIIYHINGEEVSVYVKDR